MALMTLTDFARQRNVSVRRAQQLASNGRIDARKIGRMWFVDSPPPPSGIRGRRPLGERSAHALVAALEDLPLPELDGQELARLRRRLESLHGPDAPYLLRDWLRPRQLVVHGAAANARDLPGLMADERVIPGGVSDARARFSSASEAELYVSATDVVALRHDWLLVDSERPNVRMHVVDEMVRPSIPFAWLLADLADQGGPREVERVRELLREHEWRP
jgi:hypothetical protein